jgi:heme/copper-type cytochrome/quinol oxidase subunit 2
MAAYHGGRAFLLLALGPCALAGFFWAASAAPGAEVTDPSAQEPAPDRPSFVIKARKYRFEPTRIEVRQNDLVKITFTAEDIAHSFTIDDYRIAKRAAAGQTVVFEFRADRPGTFPFYCNLTIDEGCRRMRGELVVRPAK